MLLQPLSDWHHSSLQGIGYVISKYHSHVHLPLWISMHSKGKLHTVRNGSTLRTKPLMRNFVRNGRKTSWRVTAKPSSWIFRNNLPEISWNTLSFSGSCRRREGDRKKTIPPHCTKSKLRLLQRTCLNQTCLIRKFQNKGCSVFMPISFNLLQEHGTSSSRIGAIHKRDPWCFRAYPRS